MADVFVSYARPDELWAARLADALRAAGYDVWRDDELPAHRAYAEVIEERLKSAAAVVVLWSAEAAKSQWVRSEANVARSAGTLVQARLDGSLPPMPFDQIQCAELQDWQGNPDAAGWRKLLASVTALAGASSGASQPKLRPRGPSICVLPFANMSGEPEQEYFSDGISEDITTDLSQVSALGVTARNTAFQFKGRSVDVCDIAKKLGVSHVLEGSVRKAGTRLRITAQLIDGESGDHVWAQRFDRDLTDIFAIQDEISKAIVDALKIRLLPEEKKALEKRGTTNPEAYDFYLMAREFWISGTEGDPRRYEIILRYCNTAVTIDPRYARAWALIALTQSDMNRKDVAIEETGLAAAEKALALDPRLAEPHCVIADFFAKQGRFAEADLETETALNIDPDSWEVNKEAGLVSYRQGRFAEAMQRYEKAARLMGNDYRSAAMMLSCACALEDSLSAERAARMVVERAERLFAHDRSNAAALAYGANGLAVLGELNRAKEWIRRAMLIDPNNAVMRYNLACVVTHYVGDLDMALDLVTQWMDKANAYQIKHVENDPDLARLREDPRFRSMIAAAKVRLGIANIDLEPHAPAEAGEPRQS